MIKDRSIPHAQRLVQLKDGNKLLKNLEKIREWVTEVHLIHEEKGMNGSNWMPGRRKAIFDKEKHWLFPMQLIRLNRI